MSEELQHQKQMHECSCMIGELLQFIDDNDMLDEWREHWAVEWMGFESAEQADEILTTYTKPDDRP